MVVPRPAAVAQDRLAGYTDRAWAAFATDCGYAVEIARAATALALRAGRSPAAVDMSDADAGRATEHRAVVAPEEGERCAA